LCRAPPAHRMQHVHVLGSGLYFGNV
jgi:hypothetical protein